MTSGVPIREAGGEPTEERRDGPMNTITPATDKNAEQLRAYVGQRRDAGAADVLGPGEGE